jgi:hypothetical protein
MSVCKECGMVAVGFLTAQANLSAARYGYCSWRCMEKALGPNKALDKFWLWILEKEKDWSQVSA